MRKFFGGVPAMLLTVLLAMTVWQGCGLVYNAGRLSILTDKLHLLEQPVEAQGQEPANLGEAIGFEKVTVAGTVVRFSTTQSNNARTAFCSVEAAAIRYRLDGTDPTSTTGHLQLSSATSNVMYYFFVNGRNAVINERMIADAAGSATVTCTYFR